MRKPDRQLLMMGYRDLLQEKLKELPKERWREFCQAFLNVVNRDLSRQRCEQTDLYHLLPTTSSDPTLIFYRDVFHGS